MCVVTYNVPPNKVAPSNPPLNVKFWSKKPTHTISHFRVRSSLYFKVSLWNGNDFSLIWKAELITITKLLHKDLLWNRSSSELGNGLFLPKTRGKSGHSFSDGFVLFRVKGKVGCLDKFFPEVVQVVDKYLSANVKLFDFALVLTAKAVTSERCWPRKLSRSFSMDEWLIVLVPLAYSF